MVVGVCGILLLAIGYAGRTWLLAYRAEPQTVTLGPVPVDVFDAQSPYVAVPPPGMSPLCSIGSVVVRQRLAEVLRLRCPLALDQVVPDNMRRDVLGASLAEVRLKDSAAFQTGPKQQTSLGPVVWIVVIDSGRVPLGEYLTIMYDGYSGRGLYNIMLTWPAQRPVARVSELTPTRRSPNHG